MEAKFVYYFTQTTCYDEWKKQIFIQSTIQNIGADRYSQLQLAIPTISEQQSIANYLDKKCGEIDELISIKQQKIESLKEYKKSIIYEYVTGKKEVV
jgi:type I restriction enzyme S subunit